MKYLNYLEGAFFLTEGKFCNIENFISEISGYTDNPEIDGGREEFFSEIAKTIKIIENEISTSKKIDNKTALLKLMVEDLERVVATLDRFELLRDPETSLREYYKEFKKLYLKIGIDVGEFPFFIVEQYPEPYAHLEGAALCPDKSDEQKYNIKPGVYFRKEKLAPIRSIFTLAHELVHLVIGRKRYDLMARGLEEGLCEFLSVNYCGLNTYGFGVSQNYILFRRLKYTGHIQIFQLYMEYYRMATMFYLLHGLEGIADLVNAGRGIVKDTEIDLSQSNLFASEIPLMAPRIDQDQLFQFATYASLAIPEHEVVSPLAYWVARHINLETTSNIEAIIDKLQLDQHAGTEAIGELESRLFAILIDENSIEYSDIQTMLKNKAFRYEI